jgi:hypothetical protein
MIQTLYIYIYIYTHQKEAVKKRRKYIKQGHNSWSRELGLCFLTFGFGNSAFASGGNCNKKEEGFWSYI